MSETAKSKLYRLIDFMIPTEEEIMALRPEEVREELIAEGIDPDALNDRLQAMLKRIRAEQKEQTL